MPNKHISRNIFRTASGCEAAQIVYESQNPMFLDQVYEQTHVLEAQANNERARVMLDEEQRRTIMSILNISCMSAEGLPARSNLFQLCGSV
jgi:hypothetical protein